VWQPSNISASSPGLAGLLYSSHRLLSPLKPELIVFRFALFDAVPYFVSGVVRIMLKPSQLLSKGSLSLMASKERCDDT